MDFDIKDQNLAAKGELRIEWAQQNMPVLMAIKKRFEKERPLAGLRISACLHVTTETANLALVLQAGGAQVQLCASNPLSTQDDAAAALVKNHNIPVFAIKGEDHDTYYKHIISSLSHAPQFTMDDGADLVSVLHSQRTDLAKDVFGGTEETTTGVIRLRSMAADGVLKYPIIAINDADTKHMFDNRYGTGQSTIDGIIRATNTLLAGQRMVVAGYGWCGKGVAQRARGLGAHVIVTEVNPLRALEAVMDGFEVASMNDAAKIGNVFVTVTGNKNVLVKQHFESMKSGAIICNSGHFNVEIDIPALEGMAKERRVVRDFVEEFSLKDGRKLYLLADGRLVNLSAAEGHPAMVMDMSFANQALSVEYMKHNAKTLEKKVYNVPEKIDREIAKLKLQTMNIGIDVLTPEQERYLASWQEGT
ncbi:MAG TPA: adenosylhomocysteinase [Acidobacteriota bacterium]|nr:adenosylhomocysteinase [Acidobacteriota bacterium]